MKQFKSPEIFTPQLLWFLPLLSNCDHPLLQLYYDCQYCIELSLKVEPNVIFEVKFNPYLSPKIIVRSIFV